MSARRLTRRRRSRVIIAALAVVGLALAVGAVLVVRAIPDHRVAFVVDAAQVDESGGMAEIGDAVAAAAGNTAADESLSLRRLGGTCGDPASTSEVVAAGTGQSARIAAAARALEPAGEPTLLSGILAAIDDFSGPYPFLGRRSNRIVVVSRHSADACSTDQDAANAAIRERLEGSKVDLDFRFVGYRIPREHRDALSRFASTATTEQPTFVESADELTKTLKILSIPAGADALEVTVDPPKPFRPIAYSTLRDSWLLEAPDAQPRHLHHEDPFGAALAPTWSRTGRFLAHGGTFEQQVTIKVLEVATGVEKSMLCEACTMAFVGDTLLVTDNDRYGNTGFVRFLFEEGRPEPVAIPGLQGTSSPSEAFVDRIPAFELHTVTDGTNVEVYVENGNEAAQQGKPWTLHRLVDLGTVEPVVTREGQPSRALRSLVVRGDDMALLWLDSSGRSVEVRGTRGGGAARTVPVPSEGTLERIALDDAGIPIFIAVTTDSAARQDPSTYDPDETPRAIQQVRAYHLVNGSWTEGAVSPSRVEVGGGCTTTIAHETTATPVPLGAALRLECGGTAREVADGVYAVATW
ncbi:MAG: hypothetical protein HOY78_40955 [Saccharothrix sp.]|nr:hypothetical protein [Saccharothrix sp.]